MDHAPYPFPLNDHSWYRLDSEWDYLRMAIWCAANLTTFAAYFMIPFEIRQWGDALQLASSTLVGRLFMWFIVLCGLSHLAMVIVMPTGPWWATLGIYTPMALVSAATVIVLRRHRALIVQALESVSRAIRES